LQQSLTYATLLSNLSISSVRDLEDLIIDAMYADTLSGKLDQRQEILSVDWVIGRDVSRPEAMNVIQSKLTAW
jgi:COP9 signalosome complex subunit 7